MGGKQRENKGSKTEKHKEKTIELEKDEKDYRKVKKKDKVTGKVGKSDEVVEALKTIGVEGEGSTRVRINDRKDSVDNLEERKEKKKRHKEKKKGGVDGTSSGVENSEDENRGELVKGKRFDKNCSDIRAENGEEERAKKNKKKKKEKKDGDNGVKNIITKEEKLSKERNHVDGKIKKDGQLAVEEKNLDKVRDKVQKATENGEVAEANNDKEEGKSKKKKKEREDTTEEIEDVIKVDKGDESKNKKRRKRENVGEMKTNGDGDKSKKKQRKKESASDDMEGEMRTNEEGEKSKKKKERVRENASVEGEDGMETIEERDRSKKRKRKSENASTEVEDGMKTNEEGEKSKKTKERKRENASAVVDDEMATNGGEKSKKKKEIKRKKESNEVDDEMKTDERDKSKKNKERKKEADKSKKKKERKRENVSGDVEDKSDELGKGYDGSKDKKINGRAKKQVSSGDAHEGKASTGDHIEATDTFENPTPQGKSKRVSFLDRVEVFSDDSPSGGESVNNEGEGLVQGKRFTPEEDELVKLAVFQYIEDHNLGEDGLDMILNCISYPEIKGCWTEIAAALPWRPRASVYYRGHILFERDDSRKWTAEEYDYIREFYKKHGPDWKRLSIELNKHRFHCKDTWRRIKLANMKTGHWSQGEYQTLFDLVNMDLRMRALEERKSKHGMLRDNICWQSISDRLATRNNSTCCNKWYGQLTSPMVDQGLWSDTDDYLLLDTLSSLDASCLEDVDWDNLLEHREGDICRKRWNQMVKHIGEYGLKSFSEQVETLAKRYSPDCVEAREEFDSKPIRP